MKTKPKAKRRGSKWDVVQEERPCDMPAGHKRDEAMKRVKDELEAKAEGLQEATGRMAMDPSKLRPDNEVIQVLPSAGVNKGDHTKFKYRWVRNRSNTGAAGLMVDEALSWKVRANGDIVQVWHVVNGDMPEAPERRAPDGTRQMADCILLRGEIAHVEALETYLEFQHERRMDAELNTIQDLAERKRLKIHIFGNPNATGREAERGEVAKNSAINNASMNQRLDVQAAHAIIAEARKTGDMRKLGVLEGGLKDMLAQQLAAKEVDKRIREGTLRMHNAA